MIYIVLASILPELVWHSCQTFAACFEFLGMLALGYDHINLDDCWGERNPTTGQIEGDPVRLMFCFSITDICFSVGIAPCPCWYLCIIVSLSQVRFPEGMPAFIAKLHTMGFKFGLYTDIGPNGCHHPFTGSFPYVLQIWSCFSWWSHVQWNMCRVSNIAHETMGFT